MPDLIGLFDRDIFIKLACCDLWRETLDCFGVTHPYRLASTNSVASMRRLLSRRLLPDSVEAVCVRLSGQVATVPVMPTEFLDAGNRWEHRSRLLAVPDIGQDALLASVFFTLRGQRVLVTGDKRFVIALREQVPDEFATARHGIISFEQCLLAVVRAHGAPFVIRRVRDVAAYDGSLALAIGHAGQTTEADFLAALQSLIPDRHG